MDKKEITAVPENRWKEAQKWESNLWYENNQRNSYLKILAKFVRAFKKLRCFLIILNIMIFIGQKK